MAWACVDIGSNTTRLLVADYDGSRLRELASARAFTRLGRGIDKRGLIAEEKLVETAAVVGRQVRSARRHGVDGIAVVATAAVRRAVNCAGLLAAIEAETGLAVNILSEQDEGRLAFLGATRMLESPPSGSLAVIDAGGGSTEVVIGSVEEGVRWLKSIAIGSGSVAERHLTSDPPTEQQLAAASEHAASAFADLGAPPVDTAIACGGSAGSLQRITGPDLSRKELGRALGILVGAPAREVAERYALDVERVRLLPAGVVIIQAACDCLGLPLRIGSGGLREGLIIEMAERGG